MSSRVKLVLLLAGTCVAVAAILLGGLYAIRVLLGDGTIDEHGNDWSQVTDNHDPDLLWWGPRAGLDRHLLRVNLGEHRIETAVSTNAQGFRGGPLAKDADVCRILCLGDSTTFGLGVGDDDAWPAVLQSLLRETHSRIEVINAGVTGYSSYQGLRLLQKHAAALRPDLVIVTFGPNDASFWEGYSDIDRNTRSLIGLMLSGWLDADKAQGVPRLSPDEYRNTMVEIGATAAGHGARCLYLYWPGFVEFARAKAGNALEAAAEGPGALVSYPAMLPEIAAAAEAEWLDLLPFVGEEVLFDTVHYDEAGNRSVAEAVAEAVRTRGLLPCADTESAARAPAP